MAMLQVNALTPRPAAPTLPGTWKLVAGRAITLEPREAGVLKVAHGQLWATYEGPHSGRRNESGDHFIAVGEKVQLRAGQRLVVEAWNQGAPAYFSWDPLPARQTLARPTFSVLMQPLADLRLALVFGAGALGRLATGLAQVGWAFIRPKASLAEQCCERHGALS